MSDPHPFLDRLQQATDAHDLDRLVDCFAPAYRNRTPSHPGRDFEGREQVRANWQQIFRFVPDVSSSVLAWAQVDDDVWSEWEMRGTRLDGSTHLLRGVIVFGLEEGRAASARFYLEPVDEDRAGGVDGAVRRQVHAGAP